MRFGFQCPHGPSRFAALVAVAALLFVSAVPAYAVLWGEPDGDGHPYVGALVAENFRGFLFALCTGTMIGPRVFVTAAHCTTPEILEELDISIVGVSFDPMFDRHSSEVIPGVVHNHPDYVDADWPWTPDIAVLVLDRAPHVGQAALPSAGLLDEIMAEPGWRQTELTMVGYGLREYLRGGGPLQADLSNSGTRQVAGARLRSAEGWTDLGASYLFNTGNPGQDGGSHCFGDSGGPTFLGDRNSNLTLSVFSGIQPVGKKRSARCGNTPHQFSFRLDTPEARSFLANFVTLP